MKTIPPFLPDIILTNPYDGPETPRSLQFRDQLERRKFKKEHGSSFSSWEIIDEISASNAGFKIELRTSNLDTEEDYDLEEYDRKQYIYRDYFKGSDHVNFFSDLTNEIVGPVIISFKIKSNRDDSNLPSKAIIRTQEATSSFEIPSPHSSSTIKMLEYVKEKFSNLSEVNFIKKNTDPDLELALEQFESSQIVKKYKFGILYAKEGQTTEDEIFSNIVGSQSFDEFLSFLGKKIELNGFKEYRGGLDVTGNLTGTHSIFTQWKDFQIMFHVATLLPFYEKDKQQLERKRHIGNDVVVLVFSEGNSPFNPSIMTSNMNHIYIVIRPSKDINGKTRYMVASVTKAGVPVTKPYFPHGISFERNEQFRTLLLTKLINCERQALSSPIFFPKVIRTRKSLLEEIIQGTVEKAKLTNPLRNSLNLVKRRSTATGGSPQISKKTDLEEKRKSYGPLDAQPKISNILKLFDIIGASISFSAPWVPPEYNKTGSFEFIKYQNGDIFKGSLTTTRIPNGYGEYYFSNGDVYKGQFVNGVISGRGELIFISGDVYEGDFSNLHPNKFHGKGVYCFANGDRYEGEYQLGVRHGKGAYFHKCNYYEGDFENGLPHGRGRYIYANGDSYVGAFKEGKFHGEGKYVSFNRSYYEGNFENGIRSGTGVYVNTNNDKYSGEFKNNKPNGKGECVFSNGVKYVGDFVDDEFHGHGVYTSSEQEEYSGEFINGKRSGKGKLKFANGDIYEGELKDNRIEGEGVYTWKDGTTFKGFFINGKPIPP